MEKKRLFSLVTSLKSKNASFEGRSLGYGLMLLAGSGSVLPPEPGCTLMVPSELQYTVQRLQAPHANGEACFWL